MLKLDDCEIVKAFTNRVEFWYLNTINFIKKNEKLTEKEKESQLNHYNNIIHLYNRYYIECFNSGMYDNIDCYLDEIVDNDIVNYTKVITSDDVEDWEEIKQIYEDNGACDVSGYEFKSGSKYSFIEAEYDEYYLVRY